MKRGIAIMTMTALLGISTSLAYADTQLSTTMATNNRTTASTNTTTVPSSSTIWIVKSGDSLWKIAHSTGVSVAQIAQYNGITNTSMIYVGQSLRIPSIWSVKSGDSLWKIAQETGKPVQNIAQANGITNLDQIQTGSALIIPSASSAYTVQPGDILWKIAAATGVPLQTLVQANNLANPNSLTVGQTLKIPTTTGITTTGNTPPSVSQPAAPPSELVNNVVTAVTANAQSPTFLDIPDQIQVQAYNNIGQQLDLSSHHVVYSLISGPSGASVSNQGEFTAESPGLYVLGVTVDGVSGGQVQIYEQKAMTVNVTLSSQVLSGPGQTALLTAHVYDGGNHDYPDAPFTFSVDKPDVVKLAYTQATSDVNGIATVNVTTLPGLTKPTNITLTATIEGNKSASVTLTVNPHPAKPARVSIYSMPNYLTSSGAILSVQVLDANGNIIECPLDVETTGAKITQRDNGLGTTNVFVTPNQGIETVNVLISVPNSNVTWSHAFPVNN